MKEVRYGDATESLFTEAVEFLKKKKPVDSKIYKELDAASRAKAFTVSGYTSVEVLQTFLDELTKACEEGKTKKAFMDEMNSFLERNGYEGINPTRTDVIFRTNIQTAYNAGHYKNMTDDTVKKLRPYWKYVTAGDGDVREAHAAMEGRIYRADDPIWDVWYPPNGFRCRCMVVSLTKSQVERQGLKVSRKLPYEIDYSTGEIIDKKPDKGFSNNPAKVVYKPDLSNISQPLKKIFNKREHMRKMET